MRPWWRQGGAVTILTAYLVSGVGGLSAAEEKKPEPGPGAAGAKAEDKPAPKPAPRLVVTDAGLFRDEYRRAGAFKFYDNTEDILRTGQFELAYARYAYLRGQIRGQALYQGLAVMVDQRLQFLSAQLKLRGPVTAASYRRVKKVRKKKAAPPACPPAAAPAAAPAATPPLAAAPGEKPPAPPKEEKEPPVEEPKAEKPKKEETPPPKPTFWEKLKRKALFWKKGEPPAAAKEQAE